MKTPESDALTLTLARAFAFGVSRNGAPMRFSPQEAEMLWEQASPSMREYCLAQAQNARSAIEASGTHVLIGKPRPTDVAREASWRPMPTAPIDGTHVWLTDGQMVIEAWWAGDIHGRPGWHDKHSFAHFRTWRPLGWMPLNKPPSPNWTRERLED